MQSRLSIYILVHIIGLSLAGCGSFNPNSNIEVADFPPKNINGIDVKEHIKESVGTVPETEIGTGPVHMFN